MNILKDIDLKPANILKIAGVVLVSIVLIAFAISLVGSSFGNFLPSKNILQKSNYAFDAIEEYYDADYAGATAGVGSSPGLSVRNIAPAPIPPRNGNVTVGDDAEEFEVTEYNAIIETRHLDDDCGKIASLKSRDDVIFENSNKYEHGCNYVFKVKRSSVDEVLNVIEGLDPKELVENTYTIKRLINDYTSELEILERKMKSIEDTLANAVKAYDDITDLASRTKDVESLAKIINSKISIIERLTQERINVTAQLDRLERAKAEQLDRLDYTYFNVNIFENKFVDGDDLKDSWKAAIRSFVRDVNVIVQDITVNLALFLMFVLQYIIYAFIILMISKYGWHLAKNIWKR